MAPAPDTSFRPRLLSFIRGLNADPCWELNERTSLLQSGLLDSAATLQLAEWIQREDARKFADTAKLRGPLKSVCILAVRGVTPYAEIDDSRGANR